MDEERDATARRHVVVPRGHLHTVCCATNKGHSSLDPPGTITASSLGVYSLSTGGPKVDAALAPLNTTSTPAMKTIVSHFSKIFRTGYKKCRKF
jgi:hypothetical protein